MPKQNSINQLFYLTFSLQVVIATLLLTVGYLVTPLLFNQLPVKQAGDIAGQLFSGVAIFSIIGFVLLALQSCRLQQQLRHRWFWLFSLIVMTVLLFGIAPWMADIKSGYPQGISHDSPQWSLFSALHGIYQLGYLTVLIMTLYGIYKNLQSEVFITKASE